MLGSERIASLRRATRRWLLALRPAMGVLMLALLVGILINQLALSIAAIMTGYAAWQIKRGMDFERWLRQSRSLEQPPGHDTWSEIHYLVYRMKQRHRAEKWQLLSNIREFRDAIGALPDGALLIDEQDRILWFNQPACNMLGLRFPGDRFGRLTNLVRQPEFINWLSQRRANAGKPLFFSPGGDIERILMLTLVVYRGTQRIVIVRDVTERKRLEQMRRDFVANVSHELRTPLTVMSGYLEVLDEDIEPRFRPALAEMRNQSHRMRKLVDDLLQLARHEQSDALASYDRIDGQWLARTLQADADALSGKRHDIRFDFTPGLHLLGSAQSVHSAFSNLISNAIRYTPDGGRIDVSLKPQANAAVFSVSDTGCGIEAQHLPRLTERFYRVSAARSRATGGTGLGLAIVKHILRQHEAQLRISSLPGEGSTFSCVFPANRTELDRNNEPMLKLREGEQQP